MGAYRTCGMEPRRSVAIAASGSAHCRNRVDDRSWMARSPQQPRRSQQLSGAHWCTPSVAEWWSPQQPRRSPQLGGAAASVTAAGWCSPEQPRRLSGAHLVGRILEWWSPQQPRRSPQLGGVHRMQQPPQLSGAHRRSLVGRRS